MNRSITKYNGKMQVTQESKSTARKHQQSNGLRAHTWSFFSVLSFTYVAC